MICEHCHEREAKITYTTVEGNETKEIHVCSVCFQKLLKEQFPAAYIPSLDIQPMIQELLSMFQEKNGQEDRVCPRCGRSLNEFRKTGMLGCDQCYETFSEELEQLLPRMQGASEHVGTMPEAFRKAHEASEKQRDLRKKLDLAVAEERYEDAARFRDELKALKVEDHG